MTNLKLTFDAVLAPASRAVHCSPALLCVTLLSVLTICQMRCVYLPRFMTV